jgi:hypothetical protein
MAIYEIFKFLSIFSSFIALNCISPGRVGMLPLGAAKPDFVKKIKLANLAFPANFQQGRRLRQYEAGAVFSKNVLNLFLRPQ